MNPCDKVLLWTGHNKSSKAEKQWGLLGTATIIEVHRDYVLLGEGVRFANPITPYPQGEPQESTEVRFLRDTFGSEFIPLGDVMRAVFGTDRRHPITISQISINIFDSVLSFVSNTSNSTILNTTSDRKIHKNKQRTRKRQIQKPLKSQTPVSQSSISKILIIRKRDQKVKAWVLTEACGLCELCQQAAPFITENGDPYLEVHHVVSIARQGADTVENTVALCPNCHRLLHHAVNNVEHTERLYKQVPRLIRGYTRDTGQDDPM
jgi:5-methylcytosine-specific restriction endonuclease McrA